MSHFVILTSRIYMGGYDVSGDLGMMKMEYNCNLLKDTRLNSTAVQRKSGITDMKVSGSGFWYADTDEVDDELFPKIGSSTNTNVSIIPQNYTVGNVAYISKCQFANYNPFLNMGELSAFEFNAQSTYPVARGLILENGTKTSSSQSTGQQVGAIGSGHTLYCALHVLRMTGTDPTLDVVLESDDSVDFLSETAQITFSQATAGNTSQLLSKAGAVTDDYWRVNYTIGGSDDPTVTFCVTAGII